MRILHLITRLLHGGAQANTIVTCAHQARQGHDVLLAAGLETGAEGSLWDMARDRGLALHEIPDLVREVRPGRDFRALLAVLRLTAAFLPDVAHTHTAKAGILGRWAAWMCQVPVVIQTSDGHVFHGYFSLATSRVVTLLERATAWLTDVIVVLAPAERDEHVAAGVAGPHRFAVIPSGVDLDPFLCLERPATPSARIGCVARLAPFKGVLDLVEAFPAVVDRHPDATLPVVGDGAQRAEIAARNERLGLQQQVRLLGCRADVRPLLARSDVLVMPSRNEGMGRVAVEGMAAGLPFVATRIGGLQDVVADRETGLTVPCQDLEALAEAISSCLSDPGQAKRFGSAGRLRARKYSLEVMLGRLDALYATLRADS